MPADAYATGIHLVLVLVFDEMVITGSPEKSGVGLSLCNGRLLKARKIRIKFSRNTYDLRLCL